MARGRAKGVAQPDMAVKAAPGQLRCLAEYGRIDRVPRLG